MYRNTKTRWMEFAHSFVSSTDRLFTARRIYIARYYVVVRCLSVCLSVTCVCCVETELIIKQLAVDCSYRDSSLWTPNMEHLQDPLIALSDV